MIGRFRAKITKAQEKFLKIDKRGGIYKGGIGAGKSFIVCVDSIMRATKGMHCAIVSFSYPSLRDTVLVTLREVLDIWGFRNGIHYDFIKSEMSFEFKGVDGKIILRSGDRPDALRGLNLNYFYIDEAREFPDDSLFNIMIGRLRREGDRGWRISSTTKGFSWFWELERRDDVVVVKQVTMANPFLPQDYIDELLKSYTSEFSRQELYAEEVEFGAGIIKPDWFVYDDAPLSGEKVRFWDLAVKKGEHNDYTAGGLLCRDADRWQVQDVIQVKQEWHEIRQTIIETAEIDGPAVSVVLEDANQGYPLTQDLLREPRLSKHSITCERAKGDKFTRAMAWVSRLEHGNLTILRGPWNKRFFDEAISFTADDSHRHDDMLDSISGGWQYMNEKKTVSVSFV